MDLCTHPESRWLRCIRTGWVVVTRAATIATEGFGVSPRLHQIIGAALERGPLPPAASHYLTVDGVNPLPIGTRLVNPDYAKTVRAIADEGTKTFYTGDIAKEIVAAVGEGAIPGSLNAEDLRSYRPNKLEPICGNYRVYLVCGMRPPSSGGVAVLSVLGTLENFDMAAMGATTQGWHHFIEAHHIHNFLGPPTCTRQPHPHYYNGISLSSTALQ